MGHFPEYHNYLEVILASLTPPIICDPIYELLRNHKNDALVAAVLDEHPYLLYAAPDHLRVSKESFYRFLDGLEYMITLNRGCIFRENLAQKLLGWVPSSFWADPKIAARVVDVCGDARTMHVPRAFWHVIEEHFYDFEWAKKRVEHRPPMWRHATKKLKHPELLRSAINTMRLFSEAPLGLKAPNCFLGISGWNMPLGCTNYRTLRELALAGCGLRGWASHYTSYKMVKATVSVDLLGDYRDLWPSGSSGPDPELRHLVEMVRSELLTEYVQDPTNLANLKTLRFLLRRLWDTAETLEFAETHLGPRPPEISLRERAKLDEDVYYPVPTHANNQYHMNVQDAVRLVRWNAHLYWNLSKELREDQEVYRAIGRLRKHTCHYYTCSWHCYDLRPLIRLEADKS